MENINFAIKSYLDEKGISQMSICKKCGITPAKLSQSLRGNRQLTLEEYARICGALDVNIDMFLKPILPMEIERRE